ncbi:MAG TPA: 4-alpha-glucanotransferase [Thermoanaerobaculia bacterium]|jgi:4-alpha-glucanotransferase|nr:4-alpha-glucanotransferase [Thermoanaerobaculia bacterium]
MPPHTSVQLPAERRRAAGALLHPTSLPGRYGIGDLGDEAIAFLDWLASAGMTLWQMLPLNPPGYGWSPYACLSSFAGNPLLISPQRMLEEGLLDAVADPPSFAHDYVDFDRVATWKYALLRASWQRFERTDAFERFAGEEREWLDDFALYMSLKDAAGGRPWWEWDAPLRAWDAKAIARAREKHEDDIGFWQYTQWLFRGQWDLLRAAAHERNVRIVGDVPIYVAGDSADVWGNGELFELGADGLPTVVAGVPPDYFSATGQRWGNPLYRWDAHRATGYRWWISRVKANLRYADMIRLDHFRGFAAYWEIAASEPTAVNGRWLPGPGRELFDAIRDALGELPLIAEDLGFITPAVHQLRAAVGLPGMKILQFGFGEDDSPHLPHRYSCHTVAYTGTHDNDTARGWFAQAGDDERDRALAYLGEDDVAWAMIRAVYTSVAETAIVPVQDILSLDSSARMNTPGREHDNWSWRLSAAALTREHSEKLRQLGVVAGR